MTTRIYSAALTMLFLLAFASGVSALEKLKWGTPVKTAPQSYLPPLTAEERGFWKENGLEVEWVGFADASAMNQAIAARSLFIGFSATVPVLLAGAGGVPVIFVSDLYSPDDWRLWVRPDSRIREAKDLKGAKVGVHRLGSVTHGYALALVKHLGLEKDVKFIASGGIPETLAATKAGITDGQLSAINVMIKLKLAGEFREVLSLDDLNIIPKEWLGFGIVAHHDFTRRSPEVVRKAIRAILSSLDFVRKNPGWTIEKLKVELGIPEEGGRILHRDFLERYSKNGRITKQAVENVRNFFIEYGVVPKDKTPLTEKLFTAEFVP